MKIELKEELKELKTEFIKELKITIKETQQTHHDSMKKMVLVNDKDVKVEEFKEEKSKVDLNVEKTEVKDSKDVKVEEFKEEKKSVDLNEEETEVKDSKDVKVEEFKEEKKSVDLNEEETEVKDFKDVKVEEFEELKSKVDLNAEETKDEKIDVVDDVAVEDNEKMDAVDVVDDVAVEDDEKMDVVDDLKVKVNDLKVKEIDAFCYLLRKRITEYPKTYKNSKVAIGDCILADRIRREYKNFSKDPAKYPVKEFKDYYMGIPHRNMPEWSTIDDIYVPVNIN
ncbi:myb-like protein X [Impatiens glandulifera]|uniref:myb-like protein X n=1 Tax=Impatiens glandulifera TaxID=253017 RepID=UPI001FB15712|nr:myb-like protein X [Impatiens glandulifera]